MPEYTKDFEVYRADWNAFYDYTKRNAGKPVDPQLVHANWLAFLVFQLSREMKRLADAIERRGLQDLSPSD